MAKQISPPIELRINSSAFNLRSGSRLVAGEHKELAITVDHHISIRTLRRDKSGIYAANYVADKKTPKTLRLISGGRIMETDKLYEIADETLRREGL
jgi:hypothetical protein